jgi:hypothetical protein
VRSNCVFEEDAQDGDGGGNDGGGGFDKRPDYDVFAVVVEVLLAQLHEVDAFDDGAHAGAKLVS